MKSSSDNRKGSGAEENQKQTKEDQVMRESEKN